MMNFNIGGSNRASKLRTNIYERRVLADTTPGTLRNKTLTSALYKWHYDNGLFDSIKFLWAGEAGIRYAGGKVNKAYSLEVPNSSEQFYLSNFSSGSDGWNVVNTTISGNNDSILGVNDCLKVVSSVNTSCYIYKQIYQDFELSFDYYIPSAQPNVDSLSLGSGVVDTISGNLSTVGVWASYACRRKNVTLGNACVIAFAKNGVIPSTTFAAGEIFYVKNVKLINLANDATQTVAGNQPYISGHIAPNETYCLKNVNGGSAYMTHPTISFAANQAWSVTTCLNAIGGAVSSYYFGNATCLFGIANANGVFKFRNSSAVIIQGADNMANQVFGKNAILTCTALGDGILRVYLNGVFYFSFTIATNVDISTFLTSVTGAFHQGQFHTHQINSAALTAAQALSLYNTIRVFIPEIPSVVIGSQTWATSNLEMVATPQGTLFANVTADATWATSTTLYTNAYNAATGTEENKVYEGLKAAAMWCHYGNVADNGAIYGKVYNWYAAFLLQKDIWKYCMTSGNIVANTFINNKVYYVRIKASTSGAGTVSINATGLGYATTITLTGTDTLYELYVKGSNTQTPTLTYSGTGSMTVTEFTVYADIWGWRVPTSTDFNTLATYLGGASVAGGKMKVAGTTYWAAGNTGDNSSGFSALGGGRRDNTGTFVVFGQNGRYWDITGNRVNIAYNSSAIDITSGAVINGEYIRLIKN